MLAAGATPDRISYGNTIKKESEIADAFGLGVTLFAVDCEAEVEKVARAAPGSRVICRIHCDGSGSEWPLSRKFGCEPDYAADILELAHKRGLVPHGISFHVGSQQHNVEAWDRALASTAAIFRTCAERGIRLAIVNLGGGFPAKYMRKTPKLESYGKAIFKSLRKHFGNNLPNTIVEPGRGLVGNAGVIEAEVVLIAKRSPEDEVRWVYLDIGKFHGLAETIGESIRYPIRTTHDRDETAPCIIAGPTCDSVDVLYEKTPYPLPVSLAIGDKVLIEAAGAYTATYSSVGFNGYPAAAAICDLSRLLGEIDDAGLAALGAEGEEQAVGAPGERRDRRVARLLRQDLGAVLDPHQQHHAVARSRRRRCPAWDGRRRRRRAARTAPTARGCLPIGPSLVWNGHRMICVGAGGRQPIAAGASSRAR